MRGVHNAPFMFCDRHTIFMNLKLFTQPLSGRMGYVITRLEDADERDAITQYRTGQRSGE
jgi:hypothetical protein